MFDCKTSKKRACSIANVYSLEIISSFILYATQNI